MCPRVAVIHFDGVRRAGHETPPWHDRALVVVVIDVEDEKWSLHRRSLHAAQPGKGLVHAVASDAEVPDRLAEVRGKRLLPSFAVADLVALREAVAVGIHTARTAGVVDDPPLARPAVTINGVRAVDAVALDRVARHIAQLRIELRPLVVRRRTEEA